MERPLDRGNPPGPPYRTPGEDGGRVAFFRALPVFPWKTVRLDGVPHPYVFVRLLEDAAPKLEVYPPLSDIER
jgi:hypothetical protein